MLALAAGAIVWISTAGGFLALDASRFRLLAWGWSSFDPEAWRSARTKGAGFNPRSKMVARLLVSGALDRSPREDVLALLGPPDCSPPDAQTEAWEVGYVSGFQIDVDCLHVWYATEGNVQRAEVLQR